MENSLENQFFTLSLANLTFTSLVRGYVWMVCMSVWFAVWTASWEMVCLDGGKYVSFVSLLRLGMWKFKILYYVHEYISITNALFFPISRETLWKWRSWRRKYSCWGRKSMTLRARTRSWATKTRNCSYGWRSACLCQAPRQATSRSRWGHAPPHHTAPPAYLRRWSSQVTFHTHLRCVLCCDMTNCCHLVSMCV